MSDWTEQEIIDAFSALNKKVVTDREFRDLALSNPNEAVKQLTGKDLPEGMAIKLIEADPEASRTFVLPNFRGEGAELSDKELEAAAGGQRGIICWCDDHEDCTINVF